MKPPILGIVVPCYNEHEVLPETAKRLAELLARLVQSGDVSELSAVWFVDDGSRDDTWAIILGLAEQPDSVFRGIKLSRNRGHQAALLAGLMRAEGDVLISIDADLQDDLEAMPKMIAAKAAGCDIVYGVRSSRAIDTPFKRITAEAYYVLLRKLGVDLVFNHADYRLMSRRAVESLRQFPESNLFLRGLIPQLGYRSGQVEYVRLERYAGSSKYPLGKMLALAWQGVTSFSTAPLRVITVLGIAVSLMSLGLGTWALLIRLTTNDVVPGWASTVVPLFLLSGVQLLSLGMIGEYIAKIFVEAKRRPLYFVESEAGATGRTTLPSERRSHTTVNGAQ